jgi:hypothetical protein
MTALTTNELRMIVCRYVSASRRSQVGGVKLSFIFTWCPPLQQCCKQFNDNTTCERERIRP